jgi:hypothetical protein
VSRNGLLDAKVCALALYAIVIYKPMREADRALGLGTFGRDLLARLGRE